MLCKPLQHNLDHQRSPGHIHMELYIYYNSSYGTAAAIASYM